MKGCDFRNVSIRRSKDYVDVRIFSDGKIIFKGGAPVGDKVKVRSLLRLMDAKGVSLPRIRDEDVGWWE